MKENETNRYEETGGPGSYADRSKNLNIEEISQDIHSISINSKMTKLTNDIIIETTSTTNRKQQEQLRDMVIKAISPGSTSTDNLVSIQH
jgi:hypothetical protein